jgi:hypothetical protein
MSTRQKTYNPEPELIEALARPVVDHSNLTSTDETTTPKDIEVLKTHQMVLSEENTKIAVEHIKDTLSTLKYLLDELKLLAPASQQGFYFQTAGTLAKTRLDGANMLAALEAGQKAKEEKRGGARSNHLHLNVTSAQFGEFVAAQVKKSKDGQ